MEIEGNDGSKTLLKPGSTKEFGRGLGFTSDDRTVSRRQISFQFHKTSDDEDETRVSFEVIGRNPIWVYSNRDNKVRVFRRFERGQMINGDMFCVSANKPIWFTLKRIEFDDEDEVGTEKDLESESQLTKSLQSICHPLGFEFELDHVDVSGIDPVQEFGFMVMGHEFDCYPKKMIREIKNWEWFIEEEGPESDADDDSDNKGKRVAGRKRKKKGEKNDEDWSGESEDEKLLLTRPSKVQKPKYMTRSKEQSNAKKDKRSKQNITRSAEEELEVDEDEDEDDETLGGFIVDEDEEEEAEVDDEEEEEEEEFEVDEDDEELKE